MFSSLADRNSIIVESHICSSFAFKDIFGSARFFFFHHLLSQRGREEKEENEMKGKKSLQGAIARKDRLKSSSPSCYLNGKSLFVSFIHPSIPAALKA